MQTKQKCQVKISLVILWGKAESYDHTSDLPAVVGSSHQPLAGYDIDRIQLHAASSICSSGL